MKCYTTLGVVIKLGYGYTTKYHRHSAKLPKKHWIDALCVDRVPLISDLDPDHQIFQIKAMGHGTRQRCRVNRYGFPRTGPKTSNNPVYFGFSTGDITDVNIPNGKKAGQYQGRVAVRSSGSFDVKTVNGLVSGLNYRYFKRIHCKDGYGY